MFIGASPGSCGGGIKTTTAAVSVMALRAMLRGREEVELFGRKIEWSVVSRSLSIVLVAAFVIACFLTLLLATQDIRFENLFFETVSAFGTVGLSMDTTGQLNTTGKLLIILIMYIGRIGPLTLALAIGERKVSPNYRLPKGSIAVG
jgi:trk system potassium uptake protein TrkH